MFCFLQKIDKSLNIKHPFKDSQNRGYAWEFHSLWETCHRFFVKLLRSWLSKYSRYVKKDARVSLAGTDLVVANITQEVVPISILLIWSSNSTSSWSWSSTSMSWSWSWWSGLREIHLRAGQWWRRSAFGHSHIADPWYGDDGDRMKMMTTIRMMMVMLVMMMMVMMMKMVMVVVLIGIMMMMR